MVCELGDVCRGDTVLFKQKVHEKRYSLVFLALEHPVSFWNDNVTLLWLLQWQKALKMYGEANSSWESC